MGLRDDQISEIREVLRGHVKDSDLEWMSQSCPSVDSARRYIKQQPAALPAKEPA